MQDPEQENLKALNQWADKLACPACFSPLRLKDATVTCASCGRVFPVVDGIPVLIAERAEKSDDANARS
jgi:uncharacterized protein